MAKTRKLSIQVPQHKNTNKPQYQSNNFDTRRNQRITSNMRKKRYEHECARKPHQLENIMQETPKSHERKSTRGKLQNQSDNA